MAVYFRRPYGQHVLKLSFAELQAVESALDLALAHDDDSDAANVLDAIENPQS